VLSAPQACHLLANDADSVGPGSDHPAIVVDLADASPDDARTLTSVLGAAPCVTIAHADRPRWPPPDGFDVVVSPSSEVDRPWVTATPGPVIDGVTRNPVASLTLVQLLRSTGGQHWRAALTAESFAYSMLQSGPEYRSWLASRATPDIPSSEAQPAVTVDRAGEHLMITLDRPRVHNAYNAAMRDALVEVLELARLDSTVTEVVLNGAGPSFSSGGDLTEFGTVADPATGHVIRTRRNAAAALFAVQDRTTAMIHGATFGAGIELAACCGRVIASSDVRMRLPEVSMGLIPGAGGTVSIPHRIGRERTAWLGLSDEEIGASVAQAWGLVDEIG